MVAFRYGAENLIEKEIDLFARLIHSDHKKTYRPDKLLYEEEKTKNEWHSVRYSDKLSNIAQAKHIDMRLKAMGFEKIHNTNKSPDDLLEHNRDIVKLVFDEERKNLGIGEEELKEYSKIFDELSNNQSHTVRFCPEAYTLLFEKMIRMEHNRWIAFHYLNGWEYADKKCKDKKEHNRLMPLKDLKYDEISKTVIYGMYSFLYLPKYLAEAGYEIVPYKEKY